MLAQRDADVQPDMDSFVQTDAGPDSEREGVEENRPEHDGDSAPRANYKALVQKLHINTGHASVPQMLRLAQGARVPERLLQTIKDVRSPISEKLQVPPSHRVASLQHSETPNHTVGFPRTEVQRVDCCGL